MKKYKYITFLILLLLIALLLRITLNQHAYETVYRTPMYGFCYILLALSRIDLKIRLLYICTSIATLIEIIDFSVRGNYLHLAVIMGALVLNTGIYVCIVKKFKQPSTL